MSRSRRHQPWIPITCAESEKDDKVRFHRAWRRAVRIAIRRGDDVLPHAYQHGDPFEWDKDGRQHVDARRPDAWRLLGK